MRVVFIAILFFISCTLQGQGLIIDSWRFAVAVDLLANNRSIDFDGSNEYVAVDDADNLSFTDGAANDQPFSLSTWVNFSSFNATSNNLLAKLNPAITSPYGEYIIEWREDLGELFFYNFSATGLNYIQARAAASPVVNKWYHVACTYDGSKSETGLEVYLDGVNITSTQVEVGTYVAADNTSFPLQIGERNGGSGNLDGKIDQVAIWDTVLSIDEIKEAMAIRDYNYHSRVDNLVSWWEFDNDSLGTDNITDLIGTNHGTMTNGEYADLNVHVTWPYSYQLNNTAAYDSLTPMQSAGVNDSVFGGFSWDFDGSAEYISIADADTFSFGDGSTDEAFSISAWINMDDATKFRIAVKESTGQREWGFSTDAVDNLFFQVIDNSGGDAYLGTVSAITSYEGQWVHVVGTYDGDGSHTGIKLYINGISLAGTGATTTYTAMENTTGILAIGSNNRIPDYANGKISDVIIFDKELTAAEVLAIYNNHEPRDETNESLSGNLVGYWRGYNSTNTASGVLDQSGNANHGTPTSTDDADFQYDYPRAVLDSTGSFDYDGSNEYVSVPDADNLSFGDGSTDSPFSMSAWINMDDATSDAFITKRLAASNREYEFYTTAADLLVFLMIDESEPSNIRQTSNASITTYENQWAHIVATYDGSSSDAGIKLYLNGAVFASTGLTTGSYTAMENGTATVDIGFYPPSTYFNGKMSHVSIIAKELSIAEVQELYNDGSPVDITAVTFSANVVSHWKMDQTDDPTGTVTDIVGSNNGTATNMEAGDLKTDTYPSN